MLEASLARFCFHILLSRHTGLMLVSPPFYRHLHKALAVLAAGEPQGQGESARQNQMVVEESSGRSVASVVLREALPQVKLVFQGLSARSMFQAH